MQPSTTAAVGPRQQFSVSGSGTCAAASFIVSSRGICIAALATTFGSQTLQHHRHFGSNLATGDRHLGNSSARQPQQYLRSSIRSAYAPASAIALRAWGTGSSFSSSMTHRLRALHLQLPQGQ
jgi:hypothetical protein